ncbi:DUF4190 domain-containing protein [Promicromonospora aerolata]|uniref:DUF4190 domain-containing protein n=1 Tax=Promicromonospora aerolata TaxID=195749 RepID=A0ABW4VEQ1_9MICO
MTQDLRFNMPPGWPAQPEGWRPEPGWQPDPSWPAAPSGWEFWVPAGPPSPEPPFALPTSPSDTRPAGAAQPAGQQLPYPQAPATAYQPATAYPPPPGPAYQPGMAYQPGAAQPSPSNPQATASLVLGIVSIVLTSALFATAIVGIVLGIVGLVRSGRTDPPVGRGRAITGIVLSVLSAILGVFLVTLLSNAVSDLADRVEAGASAGAEDEAPAPDPADFLRVDAKQWDAIAKDPDRAKDRAIVVFAEVTQFDSDTGPDRFRAGAGVDRPGATLELGTNTVFVGDEALLDGVSAGDVLKIHAVVVGSLEYENQLGGVATVPVLDIARFKDVGYADLSKDVELGSTVRDQLGWVSLPVTVTNSSGRTVTYMVDVVAESADGSTSYGTGTVFAEDLEPGEKKEVMADFFDDVPEDAVFRVEKAERHLQ